MGAERPPCYSKYGPKPILFATVTLSRIKQPTLNLKRSASVDKMQGGVQHFHYIIGSDLTLFASNHTGTRLIHHRKPSVHQLPAALSFFARCWLNLATLLSVLKAFTAILYCTEIQYLLKHGRRSILFATATASMRAQSGPYLGVLDLTHIERHSSVLCVVWLVTRWSPQRGR